MSIRGSNYRRRLGDCPPGLVANADNCIDPTALARGCTFGVDTVNGGCLQPTVQQVLAFSMAHTAPSAAPTFTANVPIAPIAPIMPVGLFQTAPSSAQSSAESSIVSSLSGLPSWAYWAAGGAALLFLGSGKRR